MSETLLPLIVGESNPFGGTDEYALYPAPDGCAGHRLCTLILGMRRQTYMQVFERCNLCAGPWKIGEARQRAARLANRTLILLGSKVCQAFGLEFRPYTLPLGLQAVILPHPSGRCRLWLEPDAIARARRAIGARVPELVPMLSNEKMSVAMSAVRDQVLEVCASHEREAHGGQACMGNRASAIAFLAHCLGVRGEAWDYAEELLAEYDANCDGTDCGHDPDENADEED
jgi:hypothetical protein